MDTSFKSQLKQMDIFACAVHALTAIALGDFQGILSDNVFGRLRCTGEVSRCVSFGEAVTGLLQHASSRELSTTVRGIRAGDLLISTDPKLGTFLSISRADGKGQPLTPMELLGVQKPAESRQFLFDSRYFGVTAPVYKASTPWQISESIYHHMTGYWSPGSGNAARLSEGKSLLSIYGFSDKSPRILVYTTADRARTTAALVTEYERGKLTGPMPELLLEKCMTIEQHRRVMERSASHAEADRAKETKTTREK